MLDTQNPLTREKIALPSQSTLTLITQPKDITRYIVFEQRYQAIDHQQPLIMRYKIDTQYPQKGLIWLRCYKLTYNIEMIY
ncbi:hypothetical protein REG_1130 [Candidatus Regiella insecticola LSR1]|uniref:Uncharacterized protein n=1 Tax=Candidatus Regiella insecticola LSR1 TaxID=663321 RepID=E0WSZ5_9ENTR|nr:hypothetical protein REG_1130 [Candidatus Regiella insecticola LSR1]